MRAGGDWRTGFDLNSVSKFPYKSKLLSSTRSWCFLRIPEIYLIWSTEIWMKSVRLELHPIANVLSCLRFAGRSCWPSRCLVTKVQFARSVGEKRIELRGLPV